MRRNKQILLTLIIAAILAATAWYAGYSSQAGPDVQVVAARHDLEPGLLLHEEHLTYVMIPAGQLPATYFSRKEDLTGLYTIGPVYNQELVHPRRVGDRAEGLAYPHSGPDRRLVTIRLQPAQANGMWLAAGNRVDLYLLPQGLQHDRAAIRFPDIRIMAIMGPSRYPSESDNLPLSADTLVCLDLSAEQAGQIIPLLAGSTVHLAVHNEPLP